MIDFKEELAKYKPVTVIDEAESLVKDEISDVLEMLQHINKKIKEENA